MFESEEQTFFTELLMIGWMSNLNNLKLSGLERNVSLIQHHRTRHELRRVVLSTEEVNLIGLGPGMAAVCSPIKFGDSCNYEGSLVQRICRVPLDYGHQLATPFSSYFTCPNVLVARRKRIEGIKVAKMLLVSRRIKNKLSLNHFKFL